jgi:hypothetical protein
MGPTDGLEAVVKRKILSPLPELEPPIIQPKAQHYTTQLARLLDLGVDGIIIIIIIIITIINWLLKKWNVSLWTGFIWPGIRYNGGLCKGGNEPSVSMKGGEFLDQLSKCSRLKEDPAP